MSNPVKTHQGGCHCGKVRYDADLDLGGEVMSCNCSICQKKGWLISFIPAESFHLRSGDKALTSYKFGKARVDHLFCSTCGVTSFARGTGPDGRSMVAVNARCLDDVEVKRFKVKEIDGKSL